MAVWHVFGLQFTIQHFVYAWVQLHSEVLSTSWSPTLDREVFFVFTEILVSSSFLHEQGVLFPDLSWSTSWSRGRSCGRWRKTSPKAPVQVGAKVWAAGRPCRGKPLALVPWGSVLFGPLWWSGGHGALWPQVPLSSWRIEVHELRCVLGSSCLGFKPGCRPITSCVALVNFGILLCLCIYKFDQVKS